ncbi:MAG: malonic semialdehyde reductase [Candidatus Sericytochromatia bacterium]|nr:malonic semialdehyde reductase [Candidatus Sericytochromatia bacterium]
MVTQNQTLDDTALDLLFRAARTQNGWLDTPISDRELESLYDLLKWGPTSANGQPARILFLRTEEAKQRLLPAVAGGNVDKMKAAPVVGILAWSTTFYEELPRLFPHYPPMRDLMAQDPQLAETTAFRNSSMQGGYLILAARALGLDVGVMSGFDNAAVDAEFWPDGSCKSNFLFTLGHGDPSKVYPRLERLSFSEACQLL